MKNIVRCLLSIAAVGSILSLTSSALADETTTTSETTTTPTASAVAAPAVAAPAAAVPAAVEPVAPSTSSAHDYSLSPYAASMGDRPVIDSSSSSAGGNKEKLRIGALAGVGFPRPFAIEGFAKVHKVVGVGVEYSFLPKVNMFGADTTFGAVAADLRVFPLKNGLFIGLRGGHQWLSSRMTVSSGPLSSRESMDASTWFINPRIGVLHTFESGITLGIDAGVQIPIGTASYSRSGALAQAGIKSDTDNTLVSIADTLGNKTTPTIDILRVGFMF